MSEPNLRERVPENQAPHAVSGNPHQHGPLTRFLLALAKYLGVRSTQQRPLGSIPLSADWHLEEFLSRIRISDDAVSLSREEFNELMIHCGRKRVSEAFFGRFFSTASTLQEFEEAVDNFRVVAMLLFGNFQTAHDTLGSATEAELKTALDSVAPVPADRWLGRTTFSEIQQISSSDLYLLGYLSSRRASLLTAAGEFLTYLETNAEAALRILDSTKGLPAVLAEFGVNVEATPLEIPESLRIDVASKIKIASQELKERIDRARAVGTQNTQRYLTMPFLDVYFATSMRDPEDFEAQHRFVSDVCSDARLTAMKVRHFDPTLSYVEDRITKGLIECLMLRRASATIYSAGAVDSLGKDSELAATLAQGKPVIVYVPPENDARAKLFQADHPLGLQIDRLTGVAHGVMVVRSATECAEVLWRVLSQNLEFSIEHVRGNYRLVEATTGCVVRVVNDDPLLTHSFWTFFNTLPEQNH